MDITLHIRKYNFKLNSKCKDSVVRIFLERPPKIFLSYEQGKLQYDWPSSRTKIFYCNTECGTKMSIVTVSVPTVNAITLSSTREKDIRQDGGAKVSYDVCVIFTIHGKKTGRQGALNLASGN
jgi:hypothetical protein